MLYTGDKLSSSIFWCLSVCQASVTPDQISTFSNINRHTSPLLTHLIPSRTNLYWLSTSQYCHILIIYLYLIQPKIWKGSMTRAALWPNSGVGFRHQRLHVWVPPGSCTFFNKLTFHRSLRGCVLKAWRGNKPTWKNTLSEQKVVFTPYSKGAFTNGVMLSETESNWILCTQQSTGFKSARTSYCVHLQKFRFCTVCPSFPFWNQKVLSFLPYSPNSLPCSPCPVSTCSFNKVIFRAPF